MNTDFVLYLNANFSDKECELVHFRYDKREKREDWSFTISTKETETKIAEIIIRKSDKDIQIEFNALTFDLSLREKAVHFSNKLKVIEGWFKKDPTYRIKIVTGSIPVHYSGLIQDFDDELKAIFKFLTEKEIMVICMGHGLGGYKYSSYEDIGRIIGCTRERVRQIDNKAISKLREQKIAL